MASFQDIILTLQQFWASQGCAIVQPYDVEMGAGTFHPATILRALGKKPWRTAYVQPCRRPADGRYGENPNRLQHYYQFQVLLKPSPDNIQTLYLESLRRIGLDMAKHDIRFVEDDWESPTLGAAGLGWEVWCDGMEVTQFTYFQQVGGIDCAPISGEITYGLERLAMVIQAKTSVYDLGFNFDPLTEEAAVSSGEAASANARRPLLGRDPAPSAGKEKISYGGVFLENERQFSAHNLEWADPTMHLRHFEDAEAECEAMLAKKLVLPAYDYCIKASHHFNMLDARGAISVTERAAFIARVRALARSCALLYSQLEEEAIS